MSESSRLSPSDQPARHQLAALSKALLSLHKTLLNSERVGYEESFGKIATPAAFFQLVMGDPWFAWLRSFSEFIASIDDRLGQKDAPVTRADVEAFAARARALLTPEEGALGFSGHYHTALQRDPDVILAHAGMSKLLQSLQQP